MAHSDILGRGHGSGHAWRREAPVRVESSLTGRRRLRGRYRCEDCGAEFLCGVNVHTGLFEVARLAGVPADCPGVLYSAWPRAAG